MKNGHIITHTHWDREWRYPLWENRMYLINLIDELLEILDTDKEYKSFLFDGQTVSLLDYIEMRPLKAQKLKDYIKEGKILVGPWYTLPDLYPVNGESLVRNLLKGVRTANDLGKCMLIGYESFGWGQTAQFPQIYKGFGIDTVIVGKNVDKQRAPNSEFIWEGADNTKVLATRLGNEARANFFMNSYLQIMNGMPYHSKEYRFNPDKGMSYHEADENGFIQDCFLLENTEKIHEELLADAVMSSWYNMNDSLLTDDRILMNGSDSTTAQPFLTEIIRKANKALADKGIDIELKASSLDEYVKILKSIDPGILKVIHGELRDGPSTSLSANALMSRPYIKMLNKKAQNALYSCAEPFSSITYMLDKSYDSDFLDKSMDYLLLSHPHDSINGVTQDKTVDDVMYRLNQSLELSNVVYNTTCKHILKSINYDSFSPEDALLVVFNPLHRERSEIVKAFIDLPQEKSIWDFLIKDENDNAYDIQTIARSEVVIPVSDLYARPWPYFADRHSFYFETGQIPACGYKVFRLEEKNKFNRDAKFWALTRKTSGNALSVIANVMENKFLRVTINSNGTINIDDKSTGKTYTDLNYFEDEGDCGDYWIYYPPYNNRKYTSKGLNAEIWTEDNGDLSCTMASKITMSLPAFAYRHENGIKGPSKRSDEFKDLTITTYYTLKRDSNQVDVKLVVDNTCEDHRMKLMFDTGIKAVTASAAGHFNVDERPLIPLKDSEGNYYNELTTLPMQNFIDISNGKEGLGVVTNSFIEYEALQNKECTLAVTLFRAVRNIICTEMRSAGDFKDQNGGQCLRELVYEYAICPHKGNWEEGQLYEKADRLNVKMKLVQTSKPKTNGYLPQSQSFLKIPDELQLTAFKKAQDSDSLIIRTYNPTNKTVCSEINIYGIIKDAKITNLNEEDISDVIFRDNGIEICVKPNEIKTYKIVLKD